MSVTNSNIGIKFCELLKNERERRGIAIEDWASQIGVTTDRLIEIESGKSDELSLYEMKGFVSCGVSFDAICDQMVSDGYMSSVTEEDVVKSLLPGVKYDMFQKATSGMSKEQRGRLIAAIAFGNLDELDEFLEKAQG